jgi:SAM-dependent methyltransferase
MNFSKLSQKEFQPSVFHPFYIIRTSLLKEIKKYTHFITGHVLDFGCGSKPYKELLKYDSYVGLDFENEGHSHENESIDILYDGKNIPFGDMRFDSILCTEVFEHIYELPDTIKELHRVLKKGGNILITCPFVWKEHELPYDFARYTLYALDHLMKKEGFVKMHDSKSANFFQTITQLKILLYYDKFYPIVKDWFILRLPFKILFVFLPNICSLLLKSFFKSDNQLYLNNVVVYQKC